METIQIHIKDYIKHIRLISRNAYLFLMGSFFMGFGSSVFWLLLNLYLRQLGFKEGTIGSILSASSIGTVIVAVPAAILVDNFKAKYILMIACLFSSGSMISMAISEQIGTMRILYGFAGAMGTASMVAASPFFMRNSSPVERPYLFGINMALNTVAGFIGSLAGGFIPDYLAKSGVPLLLGYRYTLIGGASLALAGIAFYSMIKSDSPQKSGKLDLAQYIGARDWRTMSKLMIPHFTIGMGAGLVIPFLNLYFLKRFDLESAAIGRIFSIAAIFTATGFLVGPAIVKKIGLLKTVVATELLSIPFLLILAFSYSLPLSIVAFYFRGSLMNMASPLYNNFAMELVPENQQAGVNSVLSLAWSSSWMVSTNIGGQIIEHYGFTPVMLITVGLYTVGIVISYTLFKSRSQIGKSVYTKI